MCDKAEVIVHVKVKQIVQGPTTFGRDIWTARCAVYEVLKGQGSPDVGEPDKILKILKFKGQSTAGIAEPDKGVVVFCFTRTSDDKGTEPILVEGNNEYVVFLKGTYGKMTLISDGPHDLAYKLIDHWLGVVRYSPQLVKTIKKESTKN